MGVALEAMRLGASVVKNFFCGGGRTDGPELRGFHPTVVVEVHDMLRELRQGPGRHVWNGRGTGKTLALVLLARELGAPGCTIVEPGPATTAHARQLWAHLFPRERGPEVVSAAMMNAPALQQAFVQEAQSRGLKVLVDECVLCDWHAPYWAAVN